VNQQIRELLKQASKLANTDENKDIDRNFDMIVAEKFAELIVAECLVAINQSNGVGDDDVIKISQDVKKHFGVE
jgi:hypothetical protein